MLFRTFDRALPPNVGLTRVSDKGLGPRAWEDVLEVAGEHISIVKLGWGTAYVTGNLERKLEVLRGRPVVIGGTLFQGVYTPRNLDPYKPWPPPPPPPPPAIPPPPTPTPPHPHPP